MPTSEKLCCVARQEESLHIVRDFIRVCRSPFIPGGLERFLVEFNMAEGQAALVDRVVVMPKLFLDVLPAR